MPDNAKEYEVLYLVGDNESVTGYGELSADDIWASALCGSKRDKGRKIAELISRRISTWLSMRENYDIN